LMMTLKDYVETVKKRITLEWALIEGQNDDPATARQLGNLIRRFGIRRDMIHVNVIPLNPTGGFGGSPSGRNRVDEFCATLEGEFNIACTPRVRRGIDINAGCGQLKAELERNKKETIEGDAGAVVVREDELEQNQLELADFMVSPAPSAPMAGVYEEEDDDGDHDYRNEHTKPNEPPEMKKMQFLIAEDAVDFESDDYEDPEFTTDWELQEAERLISLVQGIVPVTAVVTSTSTTPTTTTSITDADAIAEAKRRRKKLIKNLNAIDRLRERKAELEFEFNEEQLAKLSQENAWRAELESVEHNLK